MPHDREKGKTGSAALRLRLLGALQITLDGAPVAGLTSTKAQALLVYLAVTGRTHTRASLASLLWGNFPESAARGNLRKAIQQLREVLGPYLVIARDEVALAEDANWWVDAVEFGALLDATSASEAPDRVRKAVDLYRGDFLAGFYVRNAPDFESWWLLEQARLREMMLDGLHALADTHAQRGDLDEAIALMRRFLALEPWREAAHRRLMTWLALSGQRGAALAQYEACRQVLADELNVEPSEATTALYARIRDGDLQPPAAPTPGPSEIRPERPAFLDQTLAPAAKPWERFVGREPQLARLTSLLGEALAGQGRVAFVRGEAGWGKTRLLTEFVHQAQEDHPALLVASGTCTAFGGTGAPYLPFRELLRELCADVEPAWAAGRVTREHALCLWKALPGVIESVVTHGRHLIDTFIPGEGLMRRAAAHGSVDPALLSQLDAVAGRGPDRHQETGLDQARIFAEVVAVLQAVSMTHPLLLILDDLHWADASSVALLFHLGRRLMASPILILGAYRPEEVSLGREGKPHPLVGVLDEFRRLFGDTWVDLTRDQADGRAFVDALLDSEPNRLGEDFRGQLARSTQGHPLFTVEILRAMGEHEYLDRDADDRWIETPAITWGALPTRVEGVIERRLHRLDPDLRDTLVMASVEGETFTAEVVAYACGVDRADMIRRLSDDLARRHHLVRAGGVRRVGETRLSRYHFSHHLFMAHLYQSLDPVARAYRHEAVGRALESLYGEQIEAIEAQLAAHFQEAGRLEKAVTYLTQAGEAAARVYAHPEAIAYYRRAVDLTGEVEGDAEALIDLYIRLGRTLELTSQFEDALSVYETMEAVAHTREDRRMVLASLMARAKLRSMPVSIHDPERGRALGMRALALAGDLGDRTSEAQILWVLCLANQWGGRWREAIECGERSLALARQLDLRGQMAQTLNDLGSICYLYTGHLDRARTALREAADLWRELDDLPMLADSLASSSVAYQYAGEYERAIALSEEALQVSQSIENLWGQSYSQWAIGFVFGERGEWSRAIEVINVSIRLGELSGFGATQTYTRSDLAALYGDMGAVTRGLETARLALSAGEARHHRVDRAKTLGVLAHLHLLDGDLDKAEARLREARNDPYREAWPVLVVDANVAEVELALAMGAYAQALATADRLLDDLHRWGMRARVPHALYLRGLALDGLGQDRAARACLAEARTAAEAVGSRRALWRILPALARLEADEDQAASYRRQAREVVQSIADHIEDATLRASFLDVAKEPKRTK